MIAATIIAAATALATNLMGWWPAIAAIVLKIGFLAVTSTSVPNWLLTLTCLLAAFGVFILLIALFNHLRGPDWRNYLTDTFFDVVWRWRYGTSGNTIHDLTPLCPDCDTRLIPGYAPGYTPHNKASTIYKCVHCDKEISIEGSYEAIMEKVGLQIDHRCRQLGG